MTGWKNKETRAFASWAINDDELYCDLIYRINGAESPANEISEYITILYNLRKLEHVNEIFADVGNMLKVDCVQIAEFLTKNEPKEGK